MMGSFGSVLCFVYQLYLPWYITMTIVGATFLFGCIVVFIFRRPPPSATIDEESKVDAEKGALKSKESREDSEPTTTTPGDGSESMPSSKNRSEVEVLPLEVSPATSPAASPPSSHEEGSEIN
jgi:hypothetical protein